MNRTLALAVLLLGGAALLPAADDEPPGDDDAQDVVFIGDARPMFIRLHVRNSEGSAFTGYDAFFEKLYKFLDRDRSGSLSRTEAARAPSVAQINQYLTGNPYIVENRRPGAMATPINVEDLDADRDGRVTPEELRAYYRANAGGALVVLNQTANTGSSESMSALVFNMLDTNKDGKLSRDELMAADGELMRLDQDDDELISAFELGATPRGEGRPVVAPGMMPAPEKAEPKFGLEVIPRNDRRLTAKMDAARKVMAKYDKDKDGRLTEAESGLAHELFTKLDRNRDSKLDTLEIGRWLTGKPDTEQAIRLAPTTLTNKRGERPKRAAATGNLFTMGNVQLTILGQPLTASLAFDYKSQVLGQFRTFDVDRLGYISRKQVDTQTGAFMRGIIDVADRNGDGRMMREELVEYLDLVASAALAQVAISLTSSGQGLFEALDTNGDGYLGVREMRNAWQRLSMFDGNGDMAVAKAELPTQVRLTVGRGGTGRAMSPEGEIVEAGRAVPTRGPLWFRKMDRNGDGDVSRAEWLGNPDDFDKADTNKDALLSLEEAEALDANLRKAG